MKTPKPKLKTRSAVTGLYTKAKGADPARTYQSDDYPARMLRKLIRQLEGAETFCSYPILPAASTKLIANIKKRMKWDQPKPRKVK